MRRSRQKKKINSIRRTRYHWCQLVEKFKPLDGSQSALLQRR